MKYTFTFLLTLVLGISYSQDNKVITDTALIGADTVFLYSDKTWEYSHAINFSGEMNADLKKDLSKDILINDWQNEVTFNYNTDLTQLEDTMWLCTVDSLHDKFVLPVPGLLTSEFKQRGKRFHYGIDLDLKTGDEVRSAFDGIVRYSKFNPGGFGYLVIVRHHNGLETYYAHLSKLKVKPNQKVKAGEVIGLGGKTGRAYGDHLHFETRLYHNPIDPEEIIDFKNNRLKTENLLVHKGHFDYRKIDGSKKRTTTTTADSGKNKTTTYTPSKGTKYHYVRKGDSLYAMALKYKTTVDKICGLNGIVKTKILQVGDKIRIR